MKSIKNKIDKLRKIILRYDYFYHTLNESVVSDAEYDYLLNQLNILEIQNKELIISNSPTQKIGTNVLNRFKKITHFAPMLSLENTFDVQGFLDFENKIKKLVDTNYQQLFCCELKVDGIAISIIYESGIFVRAGTRGDGYIGENITSNVQMIKSIPSKLKGVNIPKRLEIRGEIFMLKSDFIELNKISHKNKNKCFSNPRNAASGALRNIDARITSERKLMFLCHGHGLFQGMEKFNNHYDQLMQYSKWGLPVSKDILVCSNYIEVLKYYKNFEKKRRFLDFEIDGIVIKVNSFQLQNKLGCTRKFPRWALAFKFFSSEKITVLNDVKFQVGRTGVITPVAYLEPVYISGVIIKKVSLYNKHYIEKLNLHIGDSVLICRSGDVIPKLLHVIEALRCNDAKKILFPIFCPICKTTLLENKEEKLIRCHAGLICNAQKQKLLHHFLSKNALNANGLGPKIINQLIKKEYVKNPADFFELRYIDLMQLENIGEKKSINIINILHKCKKTTFKRFIYALGIPNVGEVMAENLAKYFITLDNLMNSNMLELNSVDGIGKIISNNIFNYFSIVENRNIIIKLIKKSGIFWNEEDIKSYLNKNYFFNKKVVLTGTFDFFSRSQLKSILSKLGAKILNNISQKTDVLIYGKNFGSKFSKANSMNIKIINEKEFKSLIQ